MLHDEANEEWHLHMTGPVLRGGAVGAAVASSWKGRKVPGQEMGNMRQFSRGLPTAFEQIRVIILLSVMAKG